MAKIELKRKVIVVERNDLKDKNEVPEYTRLNAKKKIRRSGKTASSDSREFFAEAADVLLVLLAKRQEQTKSSKKENK